MPIILIRGDDQTVYSTIFTSPAKTTRMDLTNVVEIWFSVKKVSDMSDTTDADVLLQKTLTGGGVAIMDIAEGEIETYISNDDFDTANKRAKYKYDIQLQFTGNKLRTAVIDACTIEFDVTKTTI